MKALTHIYTYIMHLRETPTFQCLDLPPELRKLVYHHHFTLYKTPSYHKKLQEMAMLPAAILNVNRHVYEEASHVLHSAPVFAIPIPSITKVHGGEKTLGGGRGIQHILRHIAHVGLEIYGLHSGWSVEDGEDMVALS